MPGHFHHSRFTNALNVTVHKIMHDLKQYVYSSPLFCFPSLYTGSYDISPIDKLRTFIGYSHCRENLGLEVGKSYLIMGTLENTEKVGENEYVSCFYTFRHSIWKMVKLLEMY